ncbi:MAG: M23 family metallopeptidase [Bacteroidales bacterium]|jgi:murein DD-endopeptidase MepM/ murein hydrolase activator NlpD|nr:M23 family metallopeptidase [Bacteroidales bacterium]
MARIRYRYNPDTLSYEKVEISVKVLAKKFLLLVFGSLLVGIVSIFFLSSFFSTPKEKMMSRELDSIIFNYKMSNQKMEQMSKILNDMQQRDDNIYRTVFELEPISSSIRQAGFGGVNRYASLEGYNNSEMMIQTAKRVDQLTKQIYIQSKSYDELINCAKNHEQMLATHPAIQPVSNKDLKRMVSGYGMRFHPIYHIVRMHYGMDFTCDVGTDVYATGDGVVSDVRYSGGFGNRIVIDHGFGYKTLYAHLSKFAVKPGEHVRRGQLIGYSGNTGDSVGPHLHYEVHKDDEPVNPINYYYEDLSTEEYALILDIASSGEVFD